MSETDKEHGAKVTVADQHDHRVSVDLLPVSGALPCKRGS
jgi:hypothetical protein